jgi:hypothetical protein
MSVNNSTANLITFKDRPDKINRNGRPKKVYTVLKENGYTKDDIRIAFTEIGFYEQEELVELLKDKTKPIIFRIVANQYLTALKNSDFKKITEIMEQVLGKPKESLDVKSKLNIPITKFLKTEFVLHDNNAPKIETETQNLETDAIT